MSTSPPDGSGDGRARRESPFVGREKELEHLASAIAPGTIVTIKGPPGVGKTRLAREFAGRGQGASFSKFDEVYVVSCRNLRAPGEIIRRVARVCGWSGVSHRDVSSAIEYVGRRLRNRDQLLVLDNLEQAAEAARSVLEPWSGPECRTRFLVTSRVELGLENETLVEIEPLCSEAGVELFRRHLGGEFGGRRETVERIVERLEGIPLSIELAAGRAQFLNPDEILERLEDQLDLLATFDERERRWKEVLRQSIDRSWRELSAGERSGLAQLSVFQGSVPMDAVESVLRLERFDSSLTVDRLLQSLTSRSLGYRPEWSKEGRHRFALYESIVAFGRERLASLECEGDVRARHAEYYAELGRKYVESLQAGNRANDTEARFERALPNVKRAFRWALEHDPTTAAGIASALARFDRHRYLEMVDRELFERVLDTLPSNGDRTDKWRLRCEFHIVDKRIDDDRVEHSEMVPALESMHDRAGEVDDAFVRFAAVDRIGWIHWLSNDREASLEAMGRAADVARNQGLERRFARTQVDRFFVLGQLGRLEEAREAFDLAERGFTDSRFDAGLATLYVNRAEFELAQGNIGSAADSVDQALRFCESADEVRRLAFARSTAVLVAVAEDRLDAALETADALVESSRDVARTWKVGEFLFRKSVVHVARGEYDAARIALRTARDRARECGTAGLQAMVLSWMSILAFREGALHRGEEFRERALDCGDDEIPTFDIVEAEFQLARARRAMRNEAFDTARDAIAVARKYAAPHHPRRSIDARAQPEDRTADGTIASIVHFRHLESAVETLEERREEVDPDLRVGRNRAGWFQVADSEPVDISGRGKLRRLLDALVEMRLRTPGKRLDKAHLLQVGWPDEQLSPDEDSARLYQAISELRNFGLDGMLESDDEGYGLDPGVRVELSEKPKT